jgi:pSer/pThr/pTyr-binding forkhead associated (FHA) protein
VNPATLDGFLAACGSPEPLRIGVGDRDDGPSETWTFRQPFVVIGRRPESDLVLDHWQVSRRHAYLQLIEGRYYCVDLGSRTGTHGGDPSERSGWLEPGRPIWIGPYSILPEWPAPARSTRPPSALTWELPDAAGGQQTWRMDRQLVLIGRAPSCKLRIIEPDVSKFHCGLVLTPHGAWVVDLLGQTGVFVNEEPVRWARIGDGDELRVGRHVLRARYDEPPAPLPDFAPGFGPGPELAREFPAPETIGLPARQVPTLRLVPGPSMDPSSTYDLATNTRGGSGGAIDPSVNLLVHQIGMMQRQMMDQFHNSMMMMFEGFAALHREQSSIIRDELDEVRKLSREIEALRTQIAEKPAPKPTPAPPIARVEPRPFPTLAPAPAPANPDRPEPIKRAAPPPPPPEADIHAQLCRKLASIEAERQTRWQKLLGMMSSGR